MDLGKTLYPASRDEWRAWLEKHYDTERDIWLLFPGKASGKVRIDYNDAVEEALCFGWIDSTVKRVDDVFSAQRFSPRRPKSGYSQANKEKLRALAAEGKVIPSVMETIVGLLHEEFIVPPDILRSIRSNKAAWRHFQGFSPSYQRIRIAFIEGARGRPEEFRKRLAYFIRMTEQNKRFGFGGIEKYY